MTQALASINREQIDKARAEAAAIWFANQLTNWFESDGQGEAPKDQPQPSEDLLTSLNTWRVVEALKSGPLKNLLLSTIESVEVDKLLRFQGSLLGLLLNALASRENELPSNLLLAAKIAFSEAKAKGSDHSPTVTDIIIALNLARVLETATVEDVSLREECVKFLLHHPESSLAAISQFHDTFEPSTLLLILRSRWSILNSDTEDLRALKALNPLLLHLPPPVTVGVELPFVAKLVAALGEGGITKRFEELNADLAINLRLVQWEIFTRSGTETRYRSAGETKPGATGLPSQEFRRRMARAGRRAHREYLVGLPGRPQRREKSSTGPSCDCDFGPDWVLFEKLLSRAVEIHPTLHDDLTESLSRRLQYPPGGADTDSEPAAAFPELSVQQGNPLLLLVPDGELTFFSLLWTLRAVGRRALEAAGWLGGSADEEKLAVIFRSIEQGGGRLTWSARWDASGLLDYFDWLGLSILDGDRIVLTRRWRSLLKWLASAAAEPSFKRLEYATDSVEWELRDTIKETLDISARWLSTDAADAAYSYDLTVTEAKKLYSSFLASLSPAISEVRRPAEDWDRPIFRLCRVAFLPLEVVLRAYQPYELNLLIALLGAHPDRENRLAPIAIGFATVCGTFPLASDAGGASWAAPYWSFLSVLGNEISARYLAEPRGRTLLEDIREGCRSLIEKYAPEKDFHIAIHQAIGGAGPAAGAVRNYLCKTLNLEEGLLDRSWLVDALKVLLIPGSRTGKPSVLWLLARYYHLRAGGPADTFSADAEPGSAIELWVDKQERICSGAEILDRFCEFCDRSVPREEDGDRRGKSTITRISCDQTHFELEFDFRYRALMRRFEEWVLIAAGQGLRVEGRTTSHALWRFWAALMLERHGRIKSAFSFEIAKASEEDDARTLLTWFLPGAARQTG